MFEPLYTADEMRAAEQGHDVEALMERAGRAVADAILRRYPHARRIGAVCGKGANGGDGRIALRALAESGRETSELLEGEPDVVIDALFGTGFQGEPGEDATGLIERINGAGVPVVSVDVPSGVNASTGEVPGAAVRADVTVTMHGRKVGLVVAPGRFHAGEVEVADIGLERTDTEHRLVTDAILRLVPRRSEGDTKYTAGSVLIVGGSPGMTGAVCLAAEAAFRADAGYVAVAVPKESLPVVETLLIEAVKAPRERVDELAKRASAFAVGPGLGRADEERALARRLLADVELPAVVDADALFELEAATAGTGDVLTGVIAAFLSKGVEARLAAAAGAVAHGLAAELAPHQVGLVASDVIDSLPLALA